MPMPQAVRFGDTMPLSRAGDGAPWWVALIAGIALSILGLVIFLVPGLTPSVVTKFVGVFWLVDGAVGLAFIFADRSNWGWKLLAGILGVIGGIFVIQHPTWDAALVPMVSNLFIGIIGIFIGMVQLILATSGSGWRTGIPGVVNLAFGLLLALFPTLGAVLLPFALGGIALVGGIATAVGSFKRRSLRRTY